MNPEKGPSLSVIARETGLSRMAVSLALRGRPGVSAATRERVAGVAAKLGHVPDPEVSKLMSRIRAGRPAEAGLCLALLTQGPTAGAWRKSVTETRYVEGARERAAKYGYRLDEFWLNEPGLSEERLSRILWSRGIEGVVVAPVQDRIKPGEPRKLELDFSLFAAVEISETVEDPDLDRAIHDQYTSMLKALASLGACGYERIGLVLDIALDARTNGKWTAAYLRQRERSSPRWPSPLLLAGQDQAAFKKWFERSSPDAVVSVDGLGLRLLEADGKKIPRQTAYASLDVDGEPRSGISGIDQNSRIVGGAAIDMVVAMIHRGQRGVPAHPVRTEVEGTWIHGATTRRPPRRR